MSTKNFGNPMRRVAPARVIESQEIFPAILNTEECRSSRHEEFWSQLQAAADKHKSFRTIALTAWPTETFPVSSKIPENPLHEEEVVEGEMHGERYPQRLTFFSNMKGRLR
jgi:pyruvate/2-oxoglutarate dehydrogenase complex dihydrolipoamide acyltransferase (E2) component